MTTTAEPGTARSPGITYQQLLDTDTHEVPPSRAGGKSADPGPHGQSACEHDPGDLAHHQTQDDAQRDRAPRCVREQIAGEDNPCVRQRE